MGPDPLVGEGPLGVSPPGSTTDGSHGPQPSSRQDLGVTTHLSGAGNSGTRVDQGIYQRPPEHVCTINLDPSNHILVFGRGSESGGVPIQAMMGTGHSVYNGYQGGSCSCGGGSKDIL